MFLLTKLCVFFCLISYVLCACRSATLQTKKVHIKYKIKKQKIDYWEPDFARLMISPNVYDGTKYCGYGGTQCCSDDGAFCATIYTQNDSVDFVFNGVKTTFTKPNKVTKLAPIGKGTGYIYEYWTCI